MNEIDNFDESAKEISSITEIAALTRSEKGAKIYNDKEVIEIKPKKWCKEPKIPKKKTAKYYKQVYGYVKNKAKWDSASRFCSKHGLKFKILTEDTLGSY